MNPAEIQADIDKLRARAQVHAIANEDEIADGYFKLANDYADMLSTYGHLFESGETLQFVQKGQHINKDYEPFVTVSGSTESEAVHFAWNLTRWLNKGWVTEADVAANSVNGLILASEYNALFDIMNNRPEEVV